VAEFRQKKKKKNTAPIYCQSGMWGERLVLLFILQELRRASFCLLQHTNTHTHTRTHTCNNNGGVFLDHSEEKHQIRRTEEEEEEESGGAWIWKKNNHKDRIQ
jgi:hypothetical protein